MISLPVKIKHDFRSKKKIKILYTVYMNVFFSKTKKITMKNKNRKIVRFSFIRWFTSTQYATQRIFKGDVPMSSELFKTVELCDPLGDGL